MKTAQVKLTKPLKHAGQPHAIGEIVTLPADTAQWVVDQGAGVFVAPPVNKSSKTKEKHDGNE